jgi:hypothetical protein
MVGQIYQQSILNSSSTHPQYHTFIFPAFPLPHPYPSHSLSKSSSSSFLLIFHILSFDLIAQTPLPSHSKPFHLFRSQTDNECLQSRQAPTGREAARSGQTAQRGDPTATGAGKPVGHNQSIQDGEKICNGQGICDHQRSGVRWRLPGEGGKEKKKEQMMSPVRK